MKILMMTNTYKPILGGLERSIELFSKAFREKGHRVVIVAPSFEDEKPEDDVIRIPAIQKFNGTDFSLHLPIPGAVSEALGDFKPDIVHSHHPFMVGDTALRTAHRFNVPLVFTHHTLYEQNTHYVSEDSTALKEFVIQLATGYANLTDAVFAPSESVMNLIRQRGVVTNVQVVPTGIDIKRFGSGDGGAVRKKAGIPSGAFVVGHVGRLAPEKNLGFVAKAVALFLKQNKEARFLVAGKGPDEEALTAALRDAGALDRLHLTGALSGQELVDAYHAMDVFAFASQSETQGLVLTEAMASGVPVVGVDAPGVREVVRDGKNGRLLNEENEEEFVAALVWVAGLTAAERKELRANALKTALDFSMEKCSERALSIYESLVQIKDYVRSYSEDNAWSTAARMIQAQWDVMKNLTKATTGALLKPPDPPPS